MNGPDDQAEAIERLRRSIAQLDARLRPEPWEDDLSRHALDVEPFHNRHPVNDRPDDEFAQRARVLTPELLAHRSVFTHIDVFETAWLAELRRVLRPGGMAYLTVHNEATWELLRDELENPDNRLVRAMLGVEPGFATAVHGPLPDGRTVYRHQQQGPYRAQVFHSNSYLRNVWARYFEIVDIMPRHHVRQSLVLMR